MNQPVQQQQDSPISKTPTKPSPSPNSLSTQRTHRQLDEPKYDHADTEEKTGAAVAAASNGEKKSKGYQSPRLSPSDSTPQSPTAEYKKLDGPASSRLSWGMKHTDTHIPYRKFERLPSKLPPEKVTSGKRAIQVCIV